MYKCFGAGKMLFMWVLDFAFLKKKQIVQLSLKFLLYFELLFSYVSVKYIYTDCSAVTFIVFLLFQYNDLLLM